MNTTKKQTHTYLYEYSAHRTVYTAQCTPHTHIKKENCTKTSYAKMIK